MRTARPILFEILLIIWVSTVSVFFIVLLGYLGFDALNNNLFINIVVWTISGLLAYCTAVFWPFFKKIKSHYFDPLALSFCYIPTLVICLLNSKTTNDYLYVETFTFIITVLGFLGISLPIKNHLKNLRIESGLSKQEKELIESISIKYREELKTIISYLKKNESITIKYSSVITGLTNKKASALLHEMVEHGYLREIGNGSTKAFFKEGDM